MYHFTFSTQIISRISREWCYKVLKIQTDNKMSRRVMIRGLGFNTYWGNFFAEYILLFPAQIDVDKVAILYNIRKLEYIWNICIHFALINLTSRIVHCELNLMLPSRIEIPKFDRNRTPNFLHKFELIWIQMPCSLIETTHHS